MKAQAFDGIARELAEGSTRRGFFRFLAGAATLAAGLTLGTSAQSAAKRKRRAHHKGKSAADRGNVVVAARCMGLNQPCTKKPKIGKWKKRCCKGTRCERGRCRGNACRTDPIKGHVLTMCAGRCVDLQHDTVNCGGCGFYCVQGAKCCQGSCCGPNTVCCAKAGCCPLGEECCPDGTCTRNGSCASCIEPYAACEPDGGLPCCDTDSQAYACQVRVTDGKHACQPLCGKYGAACVNSAGCCDGVPCTGRICRFP